MFCFELGLENSQRHAKSLRNYRLQCEKGVGVRKKERKREIMKNFVQALEDRQGINPDLFSVPEVTTRSYAVPTLYL